MMKHDSVITNELVSLEWHQKLMAVCDDPPDADRSDGDLDQVWQRGPSSQLPQMCYVFGLEQ